MFVLSILAALQFYTTADLLDFLSKYEQTSIDVTPAFVNYYQDIFPNSLAKLDNLTVPECDCSYSWFINGNLVYEGEDLPLDTVRSQIECEGVCRIRLEVIDNFLETKYSREEWAFLEFVEIENFCECDTCPNYWEVFYDFYPEVSPYYYVVEHPKYDFDNNNSLGVGDLLVLLANL